MRRRRVRQQDFGTRQLPKRAVGRNCLSERFNLGCSARLGGSLSVRIVGILEIADEWSNDLGDAPDSGHVRGVRVEVAMKVNGSS